MIAAQETALFDFDRAEDTARWQPLNDTVMGGLSESELRPSGQGTALFAGNVSLENYGGFASVRSEPERLDLSAYQGLALRVRGDGKRYQIRVRTGASPDGVDYASGFDTKAGEWLRSHLPFSDMVATYRGEAVPDAPPLDRSQVYSVGLLIADRQEGPFALEVAWIGAYRA